MIQQHVIVTGLPAPSHLNESYIFVCLLTGRHSWAGTPNKAGIAGEAGGILHPAGQLLWLRDLASLD